jgi:hypothetical protein
MNYKVLVDDNFHYMDDSERYELGEFLTLDEAIEASRKIVDEYLLSVYKPGMTAAELLESYTSFGEDPFISTKEPSQTGVLFSAWGYATARCAEMCQSTEGHNPGG